MDERGGAGTVIVVIIIIGAIGFLGYKYYTEKQALDSLEVEVTGAGTPSVGLTSATIPIQLEYTNSTSHDSPAISITYDVYVSGAKVATGSSNPGVISGNSSKTSSLDVTVSYADIGVSIWNTISTGSFTVTVEGEVTAKALFGMIPISQSFTESYSF